VLPLPCAEDSVGPSVCTHIPGSASLQLFGRNRSVWFAPAFVSVVLLTCRLSRHPFAFKDLSTIKSDDPGANPGSEGCYRSSIQPLSVELLFANPSLLPRLPDFHGALLARLRRPASPSHLPLFTEVLSARPSSEPPRVPALHSIMYMKGGKHMGWGRETRRRRNSKGKEPMATFSYLCDGDRSRSGGRWDDGSIGAGGNRREAQSASIQGLKETRGSGNNGAKDVGRRALPWSERQMAVRRELRLKDGHEDAKRQSDRAAASRFRNEVPREVEKRWQTSDTNKKRRQQAEGARQSRFGMRWRPNLTATADPIGEGGNAAPKP